MESKKTLSNAVLEQIPSERRLLARLDYQLHPAERSYWAALKSHVSYWTNTDLLAFVLNTLYPVDNDKPT